MALTAADKREMVALMRETFAELVGNQPVAPAGKPRAGKAASPFVSAPKGLRLRKTREANIGKPGFSCDGHGTHAAHGFAFRKKVCPTDKQPL